MSYKTLGYSIITSLLFLTACGGGSNSTSTNNAPTASNVSITDDNSGAAIIGDVLNGNYTYDDTENDSEGTSTFRWLSNGTAISSATTTSYTLVSADVPSQITFEVTPIATTGTTTGNVITSSGINTRKPLNDTGITGCGDYAYTDTGTYAVTGSGTHNNNLDCSIQSTVPTQTSDGFEVAGTGGDIIRAGQDALYGRDVTNNDNNDGHAGFSFTKLDADGSALADQTQSYATNPWVCVRDNITGLIWEVKTTSGLQNSTFTYT